MSLEVERKYLDVDFATLRVALEAQGARCAGAHFEANEVFDAPGAPLWASGRLLRLRGREWPGKTQYVLTLKLPAPGDGEGGFKRREERELLVADGKAMRFLLEGLGYAVAARYEKVREVWHLDGLEIVLDQLPFATVVELEGDAERIERLAPRLPLDKARASAKSYHELHQEWRARHNLPPELSFVFEAGIRQALRHELGLEL